MQNRSLFLSPKTATPKPASEAPAQETKETREWQPLSDKDLANARQNCLRNIAMSFAVPIEGGGLEHRTVPYLEDGIPLLQQFQFPLPTLEGNGFKLLSMQQCSVSRWYREKVEVLNRVVKSEWKFPFALRRADRGGFKPFTYLRLTTMDDRGVIRHHFGSAVLSVEQQAAGLYGEYYSAKDSRWYPKRCFTTGYSLQTKVGPDRRDYPNDVETPNELTHAISVWLWWRLRGMLNHVMDPTPTRDDLRHVLDELGKTYGLTVASRYFQFYWMRKDQESLCPVADPRLYDIIVVNSLPFEDWMGDINLFGDASKWERKLNSYAKKHKLV